MPSLTLKTDFDTLARFAVAAELKGRRSGSQLLQDLVMEAISDVKDDPRFDGLVAKQKKESQKRSAAKRELALASRAPDSIRATFHRYDNKGRPPKEVDIANDQDSQQQGNDRDVQESPERKAQG